MSTYYPRRSFCLLKVAAVAAAGAALYHVLGKPHQCTASGCRQPGGMGASGGGPTFHVRDVAREEYQQRKAEVLRWKLDRLDRKRQEVMVALQAVQGTMTAAAAETGTATVAAGAAVPAPAAVRAEVPPASLAAASPTALPLASPLHQEAMVVLEAGQAVQGVATAASSSAGTGTLAAAVQRPVPVRAQVAAVEPATMPTESAPIALPQASLAMPPQPIAPGVVGALPVPGEVDPTPADFTQQS